MTLPHLDHEADDTTIRRAVSRLDADAADGALRVQIAEARRLIRRLVGLCAEHNVDIPKPLDQAITTWQAARAREE